MMDLRLPSAIELIPIGDLAPYAQNARTHSEAQVQQIADAIREFGWTNPILINSVGTIIAGHGRVLAAELIKMDAVPCIRVVGLSADQERALILADNKLALNAGWDERVLAAELRALSDAGFDLGPVGFDEDELAQLLRDLNPPGDAESTPEAPAQPVTRLGDLWKLDRHRLICGDSTDEATVKLVVGAKKADLLLTDPPYGIGYEYKDHDDSDSAANAELVAKVFALAPIAKVWTPGAMNLIRDIARFGPARVLAWHKGFAQAGNGMGGASTWEPVLVVAPKVKQLDNDYLDFKTDREKLGEKMLREYHPCPKPVALFAHLAESFTKPSGIIYEPFSGSGTTLVACETTGRACRAVEIDPAYVDVAIRRWEGLTGKLATLEGDNRTFAEIAKERGLTE